MSNVVTPTNLGSDFSIGGRIANKITVIPKQVVLATPVLGQTDVEDALIALAGALGVQQVVVLNSVPPVLAGKPILWWAFGGTYVASPKLGGGTLTVYPGWMVLWNGSAWTPISNGLMTDGNTITGASGGLAPLSSTGTDGDFFFDTASGKVFGAKAAGAWPAVPAYSPAAGGIYTLPPATYTTLGGVKAGAGLSVAIDGTLSVNSVTPGGGAYPVGSIIHVTATTFTVGVILNQTTVTAGGQFTLGAFTGGPGSIVLMPDGQTWKLYNIVLFPIVTGYTYALGGSTPVLGQLAFGDFVRVS